MRSEKEIKDKIKFYEKTLKNYNYKAYVSCKKIDEGILKYLKWILKDSDNIKSANVEVKE